MYGIIRQRNLKMSDLNGVQEHNNREYNSTHPQPLNIGDKTWGGDFSHHIFNGEDSIKSSIEKHLDSKDIKPRKDSIVGIEYVISASPEFFQKIDKESEFLPRRALDEFTQYIYQRHDPNDVLSISHHFDEKTPHVHVVVSPTKFKKHRFKNKYGEGEKEKWSLNAREYTHKKEHYRTLQTEYYQFVNKVAIPKMNLSSQIKLSRGLSSYEQTKKYIKSTSREISDLKDEIRKNKGIISKVSKVLSNERKTLSKIEVEEKLNTIDIANQEIEKINGQLEQKTQDLENQVEKKNTQENNYKNMGKKGTWRKSKNNGLEM